MTKYRIEMVSFEEYYEGHLEAPSRPVTVYTGTLKECRRRCAGFMTDTEEQCYSKAYFYRIVEDYME